MKKLGEIAQKEKPSEIISIGDIVSQNIHTSGFNPQLTVIDYISLRDQIMPKQPEVEKTVHVKNPQGTITEEAIQAIREALASGVHTHIVVEGEEDLLALIAVLYAPENAFVVYGQPHCGIVVIKVSSEKKAEVKRLLNEMKSSKS